MRGGIWLRARCLEPNFLIDIAGRMRKIERNGPVV